MDNNPKGVNICKMIFLKLISYTSSILYGFVIILLILKLIYPKKIETNSNKFIYFIILFSCLLMVHFGYFFIKYPVISRRYITLPLLILISYLATQFNLLEVFIDKICILLKLKASKKINSCFKKSFIFTIIVVGSIASLHTSDSKSFLRELTPLIKQQTTPSENIILFDAVQEKKRLLFYNPTLKNCIITAHFKKNILNLNNFVANEINLYKGAKTKIFILYRVQREIQTYNESDFFDPVLKNYQIKNLKKFKTKRYIYYLSVFELQTHKNNNGI